jgi:hypothetical protein
VSLKAGILLPKARDTKYGRKLRRENGIAYLMVLVTIERDFSSVNLSQKECVVVIMLLFAASPCLYLLIDVIMGRKNVLP